MSKKIVAFGEIMLRLTPPDKMLIAESRGFNACYGGTESNVLVGLSVLGNKTEYLTALPENELGEAVIKHLKSYGVGTEFIKMQGDTLGMYFLEEGFGDRPNKVVYNRRNSEITKLDEDAFDYESIFEDCSIFHISGISFALSESAKRLCFRLLKEAKQRNIKVSFDFNYRGKLWTVQEAGDVYREIVPYADILFCAEKDLQVFLNTSVKEFYNTYSCEKLIVREREILPDGKHQVVVNGYEYDGEKSFHVKAEPAAFAVLERIGGGDAFNAGVLHVLNHEGTLQRAMEYGIACFALKHSLRGDVFVLGENAVKNYMENSVKDVSR